MDNEPLIGNHVNLFYALADTVSYPGSSFLDIVSFVRPVSAPRTIRLWLKTKAACPEVEINSTRFMPVARTRDGWIDYGCFCEDEQVLGVRGFGIIRFYGITRDEAVDSWCVMTSQVEVELDGTKEQAERALQGLCRGHAGRSTLTPSRVQVGSAQAFELCYHVGAMGLPAGSLLRLTMPLAFSEPQNDDRNAPGWLETVCGPALELIGIDVSLESHERRDVFYRVTEPLAPNSALKFRYSTDFVYLFGYCWNKMERRYWWSHLPVLAPAVSVDDRRIFVAPLDENGHHLLVESGKVERLHLFLPGRVRQNTHLALTGLFTDRYRNIPTRSLFDNDIEIRLDGPTTLDLGSPAGSFSHWYRFKMPLPPLAPGVYRAYAVNRTTGKTMATSNPLEILSDDSELSPIYWGEIHGHCEQSDGSGPYEAMFDHARDIGCLDFAASADHACYFTDNEWQWMQDVVNSRNEPGRFVTMPGYEWAGRQGHRNIYTCLDRLELFRGMNLDTCVLRSVYDHFEGNEDVVAGPHVQHTRDFFDCHNPRVQRFMEIYSMWGTHDQLAFDALNRGARIGFTGGGDCHEGRCGFSVEDQLGQGQTPHTFAPGLRYKCGLTAALLSTLDRRELLNALRSRRTYATTGARILVSFGVSNIAMGEVSELDGDPDVWWDIHACSELGLVEVIRDGETVYELAVSTLDCKDSWIDTGCTPGTHWYVLRATERGGDVAWTSPIWVTVHDHGRGAANYSSE